MFGSAKNLEDPRLAAEIKERFPEAHFFGCSTAGEIAQSNVFDDTLVLTAVHFERPRVVMAKVKISMASDSLAAG